MVLNFDYLRLRMKNHFTAKGWIILAVCLCWSVAANAQNSASPDHPKPKEAIVNHHVSGAFDVKLSPLPADAGTEGTTLGRMSIDKKFHGDLEADSKGQMMSAMGSVKGSAGYVAMEQVTGTLQGRKGSFVLQHSGTMTRGVAELIVSVVPDSGTGELSGLAGKLTIHIASDGKHSYEFEYSLPATQ